MDVRDSAGGPQPAVLVVTIDDHRVVEANDEAAALLRVDRPAALLGADALTFLPERNQEAARRTLAERGEPLPLHVREYVRADGTVARVEVSARPVTWQGRGARRLFAWPLADGPGQLVVARDGLVVMTADDEAVRFYGAQSAQDLVGRRLVEFIADSDEEVVRAHLASRWTWVVPAPVQMWVVHRLDGVVTRGKFWSSPAEEIDGTAAFRVYSWPAEPAEPEPAPGTDILNYPESHRVLANELGIIVDANQPAADHLGVAAAEELIGRSLFDFIPGYHRSEQALDRWQALFDLEESPLRLRIAKRVDGDERCVLSATVPGPVVDGRRTLWVHSWTISGADDEPITTRTPLGFLVNEAWKLDRRTSLLLRGQEHLAVAQQRAIAEVEAELREDLQRSEAGSVALVALAARADQLEAHLNTERERVQLLQRQMKQVLTAAGALGQRATELVQADAEVSPEIHELLLAIAAVGRQLGSMVSGAAEASESS